MKLLTIDPTEHLAVFDLEDNSHTKWTLDGLTDEQMLVLSRLLPKNNNGNR